jgi:hypothetical protein
MTFALMHVAVVPLVLATLLMPCGVRPNPAFTPGLTRPLTTNAICSIAWGRDRRHVTETMKKEVARRYGVDWKDRAAYEFDHLIPRELAGADDMRNLWPQPRGGEWNAHRKDVLENRLHGLVCRGALTLDAAQQAIRTDWIAAYRRFLADR